MDGLMGAKDLLPCPMCGAVPEMQWGRTQKECWAYVVCECGVKTSNQYGTNDRKAADVAAAVWNRRVDA